MGTLLAAATGFSVHANAYTTKFEGNYVMEPGCNSVTLTAGFGVVAIDPDVDPGSLTINATDLAAVQQLTLTCDVITLDPAEVDSFKTKAKAVCMGFKVSVSPAKQEEVCDLLVNTAVDVAQGTSDYFLQQQVDSVDVNILNDSWAGGFGEMDYVFTNGHTEHRGPYVFVANNGRFRRGWASDTDLPNPLNCPASILGNMNANVDLSSSFGGGARIYLDTAIGDGVACAVPDVIDGKLLVGAYGFAIDIKQQGDRQ